MNQVLVKNKKGLSEVPEDDRNISTAGEDTGGKTRR